MRVILRNSFAADGRDFRHSLTVGREYEVLGLCSNSYQLLNDQDEPILYDACCFEVSDAAEPVFWVSCYGEEGERYTHPAEWGRPGYFEDWHNGVPAIVAAFWRDLERLYPWTAAKRPTRRCI